MIVDVISNLKKSKWMKIKGKDMKVLHISTTAGYGGAGVAYIDFISCFCQEEINIIKL